MGTIQKPGQTLFPRCYGHIKLPAKPQRVRHRTLAFVLEAVAPVELIWPTTRTSITTLEDNEEAMILEQDNLEEIREASCVKGAKYKRKIKRFII